MMNIIDNNFYNLVNELKALDKNEIYDNINKYLDKIPIQTRFELEDYFESVKDEYDEILNRADILKNHIEDMVFLYNNLYDYRSKKLLLGILKNWYKFDFEILLSSNEKNYPQYFELDIIKSGCADVIIDSNAGDGGFLVSFLKVYGDNYYKIYGYEKNEEKIEKLKEKFDKYRDIIISNVKEDVIKEKISLIKIDKFIKENLSYFKRNIINDKPKLIIKLNTNNDIWYIPRLIKSIDKDYKICLRTYNSSIYPRDIILTAFY